MDPINYLAGVPQQDFLRDIQGGLQLGAGFQQMRQQQAAQQLAQQRAVQYQTDVGSFMQNPTPQAAAALQLKYPEQYEPISKAWAGLSADQQKNELQDTYSIASTLHAGRPDLARQQIDDRIQAHKNSGLPTADLEALRSQVESDPTAAYGQVLHVVSALPGGDKILSNLSAAGQEQRAADAAPAELSKKQAEAATASSAAVGQAAGALAKPGVKPSQVITMFKSLEARGVLPKGGAQGYIDSMPADAAALPDYLKQVQASGMKVDDQMKYTTPDANAQLSAQTSRYATDSAARTAANRLTFDREQAKDEPVAPVGTPGLQGQQYLNTLDKPTADQVKALAEGRLGFPVGKALQSPYWQKMITAVAQYDPTFDAVNFNARAKTRNDFVAGKSAENIKAINTAIAHMGQLNDQLTALDNSSYPTVNSAKNWIATHVGGTERQGKLAAADATAEGVAGEMAKVFRSTGMSEKEIDAWRHKFTGSITPAQQKGTMQSAMHMLRGRMEAIEDQYRTGMGTTAGPLKILTPEAQAIFDKLLGEKHVSSPAAHAASDHPADISALLSKYGKK